MKTSFKHVSFISFISFLFKKCLREICAYSWGKNNFFSLLILKTFCLSFKNILKKMNERLKQIIIYIFVCIYFQKISYRWKQRRFNCNQQQSFRPFFPSPHTFFSLLYNFTLKRYTSRRVWSRYVDASYVESEIIYSQVIRACKIMSDIGNDWHLLDRNK